MVAIDNQIWGASQQPATLQANAYSGNWRTDVALIENIIAVVVAKM